MSNLGNNLINTSGANLTNNLSSMGGSVAARARDGLSSVTSGGSGGSYLPMPCSGSGLSMSEQFAELTACGSAYTAAYAPVGGLRAAVGCMNLLGAGGAGGGARG